MRHKLPKYIKTCITVHPVKQKKQTQEPRPEPTEQEKAITDLLVMAMRERQKSP